MGRGGGGGWGSQKGAFRGACAGKAKPSPGFRQKSFLSLFCLRQETSIEQEKRSTQDKIGYAALVDRVVASATPVTLLLTGEFKCTLLFEDFG